MAAVFTVACGSSCFWQCVDRVCLFLKRYKPMIVSISGGEKLENMDLPCYRECVNPVDAVT